MAQADFKLFAEAHVQDVIVRIPGSLRDALRRISHVADVDVSRNKVLEGDLNEFEKEPSLDKAVAFLEKWGIGGKSSLDLTRMLYGYRHTLKQLEEEWLYHAQNQFYDALAIPRQSLPYHEVSRDIETAAMSYRTNDVHAVVAKWCRYGSHRRAIDSLGRKMGEMAGVFVRSRAIIDGSGETRSPCLVALDLEWSKDRETKVVTVLEVGMVVRGSTVRDERGYHFALAGQWTRPRDYGRRKVVPTWYRYGHTEEFSTTEELHERVREVFCETKSEACSRGQSVVLVFHDGQNDQKILSDVFGISAGDCEVVDTSLMWLDVENRGPDNKRSLVDALRWATGERLMDQWHNSGNDAQMCMKLLRAMLKYSSIWEARWGLLGAYTLAQVPSVEQMRDAGWSRERNLQ